MKKRIGSIIVCQVVIYSSLGTFCGVFRRQALDRGAVMLKVDKIVTGHNADDIAETVLMNSTLLIYVYR